MENPVQWILLAAVIIIALVLLVPWLREKLRRSDDDSLEIPTVPPFRFQDVNASLATRIHEAVNAMGAVGDNAEEEYQSALEALRSDSVAVVDAIREELPRVPSSRHLDRWSLIQLLAELRGPGSLTVLADVLSKRMPAEESKNPHGRSTLRQETINLTTAVEAVTGIASEGSAPAIQLLLKHASHESLSVRRACIQGYLAHGGEKARETLLEALPQRDHAFLDIRQIDVTEAPPIHGAGFTKPTKAADRGPIDVPRVPPRRDE